MIYIGNIVSGCEILDTILTTDFGADTHGWYCWYWYPILMILILKTVGPHSYWYWEFKPWLKASWKFPGQNIAFRWSAKLIDAAKGSGDAISKNEETQRMAEVM